MIRLIAFAALMGGAAYAQCNFNAITAECQWLLSRYPGIEGCSVLIVKGDQAIYERHFGTFNSSATVPIASATKWLSATVVMSVWDQKKPDGTRLLDLDAPVSSMLPIFTGLKGTATMRQLFSHTSGFPDESPYISNSNITLQQAANLIAMNTPLSFPPHTYFSYGGVSMHVGGAICETLTNTLWDDLFRERIAIPCEMTHTHYDGLGQTGNPRIAGGAASSLRDYGNFCQMLKDGGVFNGRRVLSREAIDVMFADQTDGLPIDNTPNPGATYGIGTWREIVRADGSPIEVSGAGAFGFYAWINLDYDYYVVFMVHDLLSRVRPTIENIQDLVRSEIARCYPKGDVNGDRCVNDFDLAAVIFDFGMAPSGENGSTDVTGSNGKPDGIVNDFDLARVIIDFGNCR